MRLEGMPGIKDTTVIAAGLAVLLMTPLAEQMILSPKADGGALRPRFAQHRENLIEAGQPYEDGIAGAAPGELVEEERDDLKDAARGRPSGLMLVSSGGRMPDGMYANLKLLGKDPAQWSFDPATGVATDPDGNTTKDGRDITPSQTAVGR